MNNKNEKVCYFCSQNIKDVDYKEADLLRHFISAQAKIMPRKRSHLCAKHQRRLAHAIKRARFMALLPFTYR
ncbi:30S ribosomal protein S18 [Candidatus Azambacteria bacterium RIFOXYD1_FULL_42_11]|uniref:Small ribosomal subunit protein bS18 n=3 Tax=Candidatus Azamiibacteriota TaxID=1752741 RepID=A0A0G1BHG6_9BACT|nr:MAG: 30S ribosomal protein S18 [Candidatus Azambacteria bacterium GW2011_GWB1_42_17]KKS45736.1 MAG: 30S ribosomal protein S18 [Candidatus Azambacteria bacterium GW2011_GWA1_42_19]KKS88631.1 MAG: 30S ribosomal protein S18 [Parcubacteria group bacterium GW2011_GWC1_43_11]OGD42112.1 MAG: 30S ribosomal protein S18 [Candidatus Azambacteria bacterium RIFOXYD1_FULL_42_11]